MALEKIIMVINWKKSLEYNAKIFHLLSNLKIYVELDISIPQLIFLTWIISGNFGSSARVSDCVFPVKDVGQGACQTASNMTKWQVK
jgi:hypothetical protein